MTLRVFVTILCSGILTLNGTAQNRQLRVACVGDEFASGKKVREAYPAQLQVVLGKNYEVRNFTKPGTTLSASGDRPYLKEAVCGKACEYGPDIVLVGLGLHDSKVRNRGGIQGIEQGCSDLVQMFRKLNPRARIMCLLPPPVSARESTGVNRAVVRDRIIPRIQTAAFSSGCEVINLYNHLLDRPAYFADSAHLSAAGSRAIAELLQDVLTTATDPEFDLASRADVTGETTSYYGFSCCRFTFEGREARIVRPKRTARGRPWLWRARFWGHEPQAEIALLERGFHVVYCDVAELFGNDEAVGIWNRFYALLVNAGLSEKCALEGFSRGGVYVYRWAAANPRRVACVYADAPVLDFKSWPGGKGKGHGNPEEWKRFQHDFGLASEAEALAFRGNPLDMASQIAAAGFPMLHVVGDADETVPAEENTNIFEQRIRASGGSITVIHKPGVGHHPHSLANPAPIVDFILRAAHLFHQ